MKTILFVNGFLESGKTTFIKELLGRDLFKEGKTLLIVCEEGEEEFELKTLADRNIFVEFIEEESSFTEENIGKLEKKIRPDKIIVEYNGMWNRKAFRFPWYWEDVVEVAVFDASCFKIYSQNLRMYMAEQVRNAEIVVFNRCDSVRLKLGDYARNIKAINSGITCLFRGSKGDIRLNPDESLPYDIKNDRLILDDEGFVAFCIDAHERYEKYEGKIVSFKARAYETKVNPDIEFVAGRYVMTCCEADMSFIGILCSYIKAYEYGDKEWIKAEGVIKAVYDDAAGRIIPVCKIKKIEEMDYYGEDVISLSV